MDDQVLSVYIDRGQKFSESMKYLREMPEHLMAAGLLAVHSAIAFNDAVLIRLTGATGKGGDHKQAPEMTRKACRATRVREKEEELDDKGIAHLVKLIRFKDPIAYQGKSISNEEILKFCETSERFETWAKSMLKGEI